MSDKTIEFINKAIQIHGDKYDYSKVEYIKAIEKVLIICKEHGEFYQIPATHLSGGGCIKCGTNTRADKRRTSLNEFIIKAKEVHGDKYDYSKVEYINNYTKVIILCKDHGEFEQVPASHLRGRGCKKCSINSRADIKRMSLDEFIKKAREVHGDKYDYSKVEYITAIEKVIIICKEHGDFLQTPNTHLSGSGCIKCGINANANNKKTTLDEFITKAKEIHGNKYDYSKVEYRNNSSKIIIICKKHGEFLQTPASHLTGKNCTTCGIIARGNKSRSTLDDFIIKAKKVHGDKYDYSKVNYFKSCNNIIIVCKEHGDFLQTPNNHLRGNGCYKCAPKQYSKQQIEWLDFISKINNIQIQHILNSKEFIIPNTPRYKADGYCKETNTIYEFHGDYWHGNPKLYKPNDNTYFGTRFFDLYQKTLEREKFIRDLGYNLVVMWEYDWGKINNAIKTLQRKYRKSKNLIV